MSITKTHQLAGALLLTVMMAGCGDGAGSTANSAAVAGDAAVASESERKTVDGSSSNVALGGVTASIESPRAAKNTGTATDKTSESKSPFPEDDATKTLREIQQLRISAVPTDLAQARTARRERNERIVEMATNVLRLTMNDESRKSQFHQGIGQLLEARFQMALSGTKEDVELFYADVDALTERDPKSIAAAEGMYYIARFAHTKAGMIGRKEPIWFETLSRWAREFGDRFPEQTQRAVSLLFGAARSCELQSAASDDAVLATRMMTESKLCYTALAEKFGTTEQGQEATASLRRLALPGQVLSQFSGPTSDGGFVSADEFPGKPTLIYFWDSESDEFSKDLLPLLEKIRADVSSDRLRIVGVTLDDDESTMNSFMETHSVPGQQIFFPNAEQRSWNSPLVRFWGIANSPTVWLLDAQGKVVSTAADADNLTAWLQKVLK